MRGLKGSVKYNVHMLKRVRGSEFSSAEKRGAMILKNSPEKHERKH